MRETVGADGPDDSLLLARSERAVDAFAEGMRTALTALLHECHARGWPAGETVTVRFEPSCDPTEMPAFTEAAVDLSPRTGQPVRLRLTPGGLPGVDVHSLFLLGHVTAVDFEMDIPTTDDSTPGRQAAAA